MPIINKGALEAIRMVVFIHPSALRSAITTFFICLGLVSETASHLLRGFDCSLITDSAGSNTSDQVEKQIGYHKAFVRENH